MLFCGGFKSVYCNEVWRALITIFITSHIPAKTSRLSNADEWRMFKNWLKQTLRSESGFKGHGHVFHKLDSQFTLAGTYRYLSAEKCLWKMSDPDKYFSIHPLNSAAQTSLASSSSSQGFPRRSEACWELWSNHKWAVSDGMEAGVNLGLTEKGWYVLYCNSFDLANTDLNLDISVGE